MKTHCNICGRESANDLPMSASQKRRNASCGRDLTAEWEEECDGYAKGFTAGRRAAFKEAIAIIRKDSHASDVTKIFMVNAIRAAMKGRKS